MNTWARNTEYKTLFGTKGCFAPINKRDMIKENDFDTEVYNWLREHGSDETRQLIEMTARHFWEMGRRDERMEMMAEQCQYRGTMILTPTETRGWEAIDWCYYKEKQIKEKCPSNCPYKAKEE